MSFVHDVLENPDVLEGEATVADLLPEPGPVLAAGLRLIAIAIRTKRKADDINAITAKYSAQAQTIADKW